MSVIVRLQLSRWVGHGQVHEVEGIANIPNMRHGSRKMGQRGQIQRRQKTRREGGRGRRKRGAVFVIPTGPVTLLGTSGCKKEGVGGNPGNGKTDRAARGECGTVEESREGRGQEAGAVKKGERQSGATASGTMQSKPAV